MSDFKVWLPRNVVSSSRVTERYLWDSALAELQKHSVRVCVAYDARIGRVYDRDDSADLLRGDDVTSTGPLKDRRIREIRMRSEQNRQNE